MSTETTDMPCDFGVGYIIKRIQDIVILVYDTANNVVYKRQKTSGNWRNWQSLVTNSDLGNFNAFGPFEVSGNSNTTYNIGTGAFLFSCTQNGAWGLQGLALVSTGVSQESTAAYKICGGGSFMDDQRIILTPQINGKLTITNNTEAAFSLCIYRLATK